MKAALSLHTHQFKRAPREPEGGRTNQSLGSLARIAPLGLGAGLTG